MKYFLLLLLLISNQAFTAYVPYPVSSKGQKEHVERVRINNNGTATIASQSGSWVVSAVRTALGRVTVTYTGAFSVIPACSCSQLAGNTFRGCSITPSLNSALLETFGTSTSTPFDYDDMPFTVQCQGPY